MNTIMVMLEGKNYDLDYDDQDPYVDQNLRIAFCDQLAEDFVPLLFDPRGYGSLPFPPDMIAYRLIIDHQLEKLCILYEVYWRRQDCTWKELNKDHDHDYEQIQIQFNLKTGKKEKIIISSTGPIENGGHGVEIYYDTPQVAVKTVPYKTNSKRTFPWGGNYGQNNATQIRLIPIAQLKQEKGKPIIVVLNCYHAFAGLKRTLLPEEKILISVKIEKLNQSLLEKWFFLHTKNRFAHDISKPFDEPHVMYYPPPDDWFSKLAYGYMWIISSMKRLLKL